MGEGTVCGSVAGHDNVSCQLNQGSAQGLAVASAQMPWRDIVQQYTTGAGLQYGAWIGYNTRLCRECLASCTQHGTREDVELTSRIIMRGAGALRFMRVYVRKRAGASGEKNMHLDVWALRVLGCRIIDLGCLRATAQGNTRNQGEVLMALASVRLLTEEVQQ